MSHAEQLIQDNLQADWEGEYFDDEENYPRDAEPLLEEVIRGGEIQGDITREGG